ncbi:MAG: hypothetical protein Sapg2KO_14230 [Saprospiraceae bacterium]
MKKDVKFNNFLLNYNSGELTNTSNKKEDKVIRLSPQAAKLLEILIQNYPEMVSKQEIKSLLWPNVEVGFDNSLHFCIRQIRVALKDNVSNPSYVETIPRRGYRWLVEVKPVRKKRKTTFQWILAIFLLIMFSISFNQLLFKKNKGAEAAITEDSSKIRLVIMPLQPRDSLNLFYGNGIAYDLLSLTGNLKELEVIGPTTTQQVNQDKVYDFLESSDADYLINGKFSGIENESRLLVEIIRESDKAHIWVASYPANTSFDQITSEVFDGFLEK